jgi:rhamnose utilization protein RhaD (predicted bifunctional aldolase and dehydrogenase)
MDELLKQLIEMSHRVGKDNTLVQGSGGNTSVKSDDGNFMYIKASGTSLGEMDEQKGWRYLNIAEVLSILGDEKVLEMSISDRELEVVKRLKSSCVDRLDTDARPSVESHLHAFLDRVVIHTHPLAVLPFVCSRKGEEILEGLFDNLGKPILWIPYADPGFGLAQKVSEKVKAYKSKYDETPSVMFLQKHGLVVSGQTADRTLELVHQVVGLCRENIEDIPVPEFACPEQGDISQITELLRDSVAEITDSEVKVMHFLDDEIRKFISDSSASELAAYPATVPEELAYSNGPAVWLDNVKREIVREKIEERISQGMRHPAAFLVKGTGLFITGTDSSIPMSKDVITASLFIRRTAEQFGGVEPMTKPERDFIANWEAEDFRIQLAHGAKK